MIPVNFKIILLSVTFIIIELTVWILSCINWLINEFGHVLISHISLKSLIHKWHNSKFTIKKFYIVVLYFVNWYVDNWYTDNSIPLLVYSQHPSSCLHYSSTWCLLRPWARRTSWLNLGRSVFIVVRYMAFTSRIQSNIKKNNIKQASLKARQNWEKWECKLIYINLNQVISQ